ncbi:MAG: tryptophan synthase subunit alpha, partial [Acholeplasmataceae bacterium]|nr:tryptophan synthase subunit alpha [Acholeplasmataceae bacterium]
LDHHLKDIIYVGTEFPDIRAFLIEKGINVASYIRFHLPKDDIDAARQTNGFIYLQAKPGDSPIHENQTLESNIKYLREILKFNRPVYCGVGISTEEDVRMVRMAKADGVFVGSVILKLQDDIEALKQKIANLKQNT